MEGSSAASSSFTSWDEARSAGSSAVADVWMDVTLNIDDSRLLRPVNKGHTAALASALRFRKVVQCQRAEWVDKMLPVGVPATAAQWDAVMSCIFRNDKCSLAHLRATVLCSGQVCEDAARPGTDCADRRRLTIPWSRLRKSRCRRRSRKPQETCPISVARRPVQSRPSLCQGVAQLGQGLSLGQRRRPLAQKGFMTNGNPYLVHACWRATLFGAAPDRTELAPIPKLPKRQCASFKEARRKRVIPLRGRPLSGSGSRKALLQGCSLSQAGSEIRLDRHKAPGNSGS